MSKTPLKSASQPECGDGDAKVNNQGELKRPANPDFSDGTAKAADSTMASDILEPPQLQCAVANQKSEKVVQDCSAKEPPVPDWVADMNKQFAYIKAAKNFYRFEHEDFISRSALVTELENKPLVEADESGVTRLRSRATAWIRSPHRAQYRNLTFAPGEPPITSSNDVNTFKGFSVVPVHGDIAPYLKLRDYLFPDPAECRYIEQWLAHKLQHPGTKMTTALVVWSKAQGVGKNLFFETIGQIIGEKHYGVIAQRDLLNAFNPWAKDRLLVIGEEVLGSEDRKEADHFKGLITGTKVMINIKNQPQYESENHMSFVFLSNHDDAVHLDTHNRRYFVAEIKAAPLPPQFYEHYAKWRDGGGLAALHYHLINQVNLKGFDPKARPPMTAAQQAMIAAGRSELEQWMADALEDPHGYFGGEVITTEMLKLCYWRATGDRCSVKSLLYAAKKAGAQQRNAQIRTKDKTKVRVMSLANHDKWANCTETEWAEELERVAKHRKKPD